VISLDKITKEYHMGTVTVTALDDVSLNIDAGELLAILGPSGSGKSTLMNLLGCLDTPSDGTYTLDGELVSTMNRTQLAAVRNRKIGFVFQNFNLLAYATAQENVELPLIYSKTATSVRRKRALELLDLVGLGDRVKHRPAELSGGQRQRVAVARALANDPEIILADEPTGNLDSKSGDEILRLFVNLHERGKTLIVVTHDKNIASHCGRVISLLDGKIDTDIRNGNGKHGGQ
jgi:putative ABC transport system ATP-binding protein